MQKLILTEEEQMVRESAADFLSQKAGPGALRQIRDTANPQGFSSEVWLEMAELGWPSILIEEAQGGLGFSHAAMGQIMELCGSTLACSPLFSTAVVGASALSLGVDRLTLLPKVAAGSLTLALAIDETPRHNPQGIATSADRRGDGYTLNGEKTFVVDGNVADYLIVSVRADKDPDDVLLFLVPRDAEGLTITKTEMVDSRNSATVQINDVTVDSDQLISQSGAGLATLQKVLNIANVHLSAELLGIANECLGRTLKYLTERKQFGVEIGSFQGLQHRAAILWTEIELCKSIVLKALRALDESPGEAGLLASTAKAKTCQVAELASNEGIQMHGGIGMTDEFDMGFFIKRARVAQMLYGDRRYHLNRYAELRAY